MEKSDESVSRIRYLANDCAIVVVPSEEAFMFLLNVSATEKVMRFDRCLRMTRKEAHKAVDSLDNATAEQKKYYHAAISAPTDAETDKKNRECAE